MRLAELVDLCRALEGTRSRLAKTQHAAEFLRRLGPAEVALAVAYLTGRPFPASDPRVLEVSGATFHDVGERLQPPADAPSLELTHVAQAFDAIAAARGPGSRRAKAEALAGLLDRATVAEREVLHRIVHGEMRVGLHEGLLPDVLAAATGVAPALVRRALLFLSDPAVVASLALAEGEAGLTAADVRLFVPLLPMLAEPAVDLAAALRAHGGRAALEVKYDGARIQLHKGGDQVRVWSRRLTELTASVPELVELARREMGAGRCILDGEVIGVSLEGRPLPFQDLMRRLRRVHGVARSAAEIPLAFHFFDCLLDDEGSLIDAPYEARWHRLAGLVPARCLARQALVTDPASAEAFQAAALGAGHEGVLVKALDSLYTPGTRGRRWFKVKPAPTIDCVIVAADRGSGRRRGWLSNYHLAVADGAGALAPVGKTFKGLTDREFEAMTARLAALAVADDGYTVTVRPEVVVEVAYAEIQRSPRYRSELALRFARITRIRDDKAPGDATSLAELRALYEQQFAARGRRSEDPLGRPAEPPAGPGGTG